MRCCCAQVTSCWEDPDATLQKIHPLVSDAAKKGASLIAFPEQFTTGWDPSSSLHLQDGAGPIVSTLQQYAEEFGIAILGSFRERHLPLPLNTAIAIRSDGTIAARYSKIHPFTFAGEERNYSAGDALGIFEVQRFRLGIAICYDLRFPELFRIYADHNVHGVIVPSAWPENRLHHWELFLKARAAENQMYMIGINPTGKTPVDTFAGMSMVAGPDGTIVARADQSETLLIVDLDANTVKDARCGFPAYKDRQPGIYQRLWK